MEARGKSRFIGTSPLVQGARAQGLKGRNIEAIRDFRAEVEFAVTRGDAFRFASRLPLAFVFRALGAEVPSKLFSHVVQFPDSTDVPVEHTSRVIALGQMKVKDADILRHHLTQPCVNLVLRRSSEVHSAT